MDFHLRQLGALRVEGCGDYEDHHEFSVDEIEEAITRVRELSRDPSYEHACIVLTQKDFSRQEALWATILSKYSSELWSPLSKQIPLKDKQGHEEEKSESNGITKSPNDAVGSVQNSSTHITESVDGNSSGERSDSKAQKPKKWGAYILHSELQVVESDKRFSSQKAALTAMLRISIDNFRRRNFT